MSEEAAKKVREWRDRYLLAQRDCAWCSFRAESADELADHIVANHYDAETGKYEE